MDYKTRLNFLGLRATPQRISLMTALAQNGHMTIDELFCELKPRTPALSLSTVYNNLYALVKKGVAREVAIAGCRQVFELTAHEHAHHICKECGQISDIPIDCGEILRLIKAPDGAVLTDCDLVLGGVCAKCAQKDRLQVGSANGASAANAENAENVV